VLRVGLTGGIGSGKSTVSARLAERGAVVVDADLVAREVVEPGMPALAAIVDRFGPSVVHPDGALDRPALGRLVFGDPAALADLEGITHPAIWARTAELVAAAPDDAVVVHDMPLLVEKDLGADYHLVVVVGASEETRLRRLVELRGMPAEDAGARVAAQAGDDARRAAADFWLDNEGTPEQLATAVDRLWDERLVPFERNVRDGIRVPRPDHVLLSEPDPTWPAQAARLAARVRRALGPGVVDVEHIGSTAVPGLVAEDVVDLQVGVRSLADAAHPAWVARMAAAGHPREDGIREDAGPDGTVWPTYLHGGCDPGRPVSVHVREAGSPGHRWALAFRDLLCADADVREEYAALGRELAARGLPPEEYALAKEPWLAGIATRLPAP
jgi:dephospho-CoA kinase